MNIAIVGSEEQYWNPLQKKRAKAFICEILSATFTPESQEAVLVSGHCPEGGVDIWAEQASAYLGLKKPLIFKAGVDQWKDKVIYRQVVNELIELKEIGFESRNKLIAVNCNVIYDIEPEMINGKTRHSGGVWTLNRAFDLGKPCFLVVVYKDGITGTIKVKERIED